MSDGEVSVAVFGSGNTTTSESALALAATFEDLVLLSPHMPPWPAQAEVRKMTSHKHKKHINAETITFSNSAIESLQAGSTLKGLHMHSSMSSNASLATSLTSAYKLSLASKSVKVKRATWSQPSRINDSNPLS
jgi:hypothetical protein